jgi:tRNA-modifying protein YgfZ
VRETILHDRLRGLGAVFEERHGWLVATRVAGIDAEGHAVRAAVALADRGDRALTLISGADATRFLQGLVTNDVDPVQVGDATYALMLTPKARIVTDLRLTRLDQERFLADCEPDAADAMRGMLRRYRLAARVVIEPAEDRYAMLLIAGPRSGALITDAFNTAPAFRENAGTWLDAGERRVLALGSVVCGEDAVELIAEHDALRAAFDACYARLEAHEGCVVGADAVEALRIEAGVPRAGAELTEQVMPAEAGVVERAVSFTKGCFVGQEPVARLHHRGHANRGLAMVAMDEQAPVVGAAVEAGGRDAGWVTSAAWSPTLRRGLALVIARRELLDGQRVVIAGREGTLRRPPALPGMRPG